MKRFEKRVWLSTPTKHEEELVYVTKAYEENWKSTVGENIDVIEMIACKKLGCKYAVALSCGTAALHLAVKLAGVKEGDHVFCTDMTFAASANPILYEKAIPIFIGTERDTWNMDPRALEKAFALYPDTKVVVVANLYGVPAKFDEICAIAARHGAVIIEDAAESLGATYKGRQTGTFGTYNALSFNGNKIITGSSGGMLVTDDPVAIDRARKWSKQSREKAPWYQHEEVGYNYRMSNIIAGIIRGQFPHLEEHIAQKKAIYERYKEGLRDLPVTMNPYPADTTEPNFWLSCLLIDQDAMCKQVRTDSEAYYVPEYGKSCPTQILETLEQHNIEGRPIWKPMHAQPLYRTSPYVTKDGDGREENGSFAGDGCIDVGMDIFERGLCLPSDNKMTVEEQDEIIRLIHACFASVGNGVCKKATDGADAQAASASLPDEKEGSKKQLLILGAGQYGLVAREVARAMGVYGRIDFLDDHNKTAVGKLGDIEKTEYDEAFVAIGNPAARMRWLQKISKLATLIHPNAVVSPSAVIGDGSVVEAGAVISTDVKIGRGTIVMANAVVGHNAAVGECCQLKYGSAIPENCVVPDCTKVDCNVLYNGMPAADGENGQSRV